MGATFTTVKVRNIIADSEEVELRVKVDSGATMLVIPGWLQENLNFPVIRKQQVKYANEKLETKDVVYGVEIEVCDRKTVATAVVEPQKRYGLLGTIVMEELDLIIEPRELKVYPNPRSPDMPMAEIE
ncbi:MAG: aspartyl protease family protein [Candidatus Poribacteria bacterium]